VSIATQLGDSGQTSLPGGARVSKANPRVEAYGTIDELISTMGLARALCTNAEIRDLTKSIQRELFTVGSALGMAPESRKPPVEISGAMVERLTSEVHRIEATPGILADWSLPGEDVQSAAFDVARTVCRRAERLAARLSDDGDLSDPNVLRYLNRLSDLLWLLGRQIEVEQGINSRLREGDAAGPRWSRAW
jgi:cob(I)alamin adenosyltransferase